MINEREVRFLPMEVRTEEENEGVITGYPIVFNQETDLGYGIREVIAPESVGDGKVLRDVALMVGHDFGMIPLAHSRNNNENSTMYLAPDEHGVHMRARLDIKNNPKAAEVYSAIKRGDVSGMSFAFIVDKEEWEGVETEHPLRRITGFSDIYECSIVAFPAYPGTSVQAASISDALESVKEALESERQRLANERARDAELQARKAAWERYENLVKEVRDHEV